MSLIGILLGLGLLIWLAYRGWSVLLLAPIAASVAALFSGAPLLARSTGVLEKLADALAGEVPIIGVGGILSGADAAAKIEAGARLVQLYTGFIYRGPALIAEAAAAIAAARTAGE